MRFAAILVTLAAAAAGPLLPEHAGAPRALVPKQTVEASKPTALHVAPRLLRVSALGRRGLPLRRRPEKNLAVKE